MVSWNAYWHCGILLHIIFLLLRIFHRHHDAYFVFGRPSDADKVKNESEYNQRLATHLKYKAIHQALMWMIEDSPEDKAKFVEWG